MTVPGSQLNAKQVRAKSQDAKTNVEYGNNGTIGPLVLNPGSTNVCEEKGKCMYKRTNKISEIQCYINVTPLS